MRKILIQLSFLLLFVACSKSVDVIAEDESVITNPEVVTFYASIEGIAESRATGGKTSWSDGDQVAVFVSDEDGDYSGPYCYDIDESGAMIASNGVDPFVVAQSSCDYRAFYPYNSEYTDIDDYESVSISCDDIMSSTASGSTEVKFTFSHDLALLNFQFSLANENISITKLIVPGYDYDITDSAVEVKTSQTTYETITDETTGEIECVITYKTIKTCSAYVFISSDEDPDDVSLVVTYSFDSDSDKDLDFTFYYELTNSEVTKWESGYNYTYNL